jgi:WD40 repeat protein
MFSVPEPGHDAALSPNGKIMAMTTGKNVVLFDAETGTIRHTLTGHTNTVAGLAFSPSGEVLASSSLDHSVRLWNIATGKEIRTLTTSAPEWSSVAFSPDGKRLMVAGSLLYVRDGTEIYNLKQVVGSSAFSPGVGR